MKKVVTQIGNSIALSLWVIKMGEQLKKFAAKDRNTLIFGCAVAAVCIAFILALVIVSLLFLDPQPQAKAKQFISGNTYNVYEYSDYDNKYYEYPSFELDFDDDLQSVNVTMHPTYESSAYTFEAPMNVNEDGTITIHRKDFETNMLIDEYSESSANGLMEYDGEDGQKFMMIEVSQ